MFRRTVLSTAVAVALGSSVASVATYANEGSVEKLEKIQVTGSRISRVDAEGNTPLAVFDREAIENSGAATVAEFLRDSPTIGGPEMVTENESLSQVAGASGTNYRGFGADATLVLLNGRRLPDNPIASTFVDINQLPTAAVERIEILNDGASAIYGSDAVAGVINIITKTSYEGATVGFKSGLSSESDGNQNSISIVTGKSMDKARVLFTVDAFKQGIVKASDRAYSKSAVSPVDGNDDRSAYGYPASVFTSDFSFAGAPAGCSAENTVPSSNASAGKECSYDFASDYQLVPDSERYGVFGIFEYDLTETATAYTQLRYNRAKTITSNASAPGFLTVDVTNEYLPYVKVARRWIEFGKREKENINSTVETIAGVHGVFESNEFIGDVNWQFELGHSRTTGVQKGINGQLFRSNMTEGVKNGEINPFDPTKNDASTVAKYQQAPERKGELKLSFANVQMDGFIDDYELGWAYGLETRKVSYFDKVSENYDDIIGGASGNGGGDRNVKATYLELSQSPMDMLELGAAVRYDRYSDFGSSTTGKLSAGLRPVDSVLLRSSISTGFKAPDLKELYLGQSEGVLKVVDTKVCDATKADPSKTKAEKASACKKKEVASNSGGNPDLEAEKSTALNLGIVWSVTDQLSVSADYWDITVDDKISLIGLQEIINNEDKYSHLVKRSPAGTLGGKETGSLVTDIYQNVSEERGKGLDLSVRYSLPTNYGDFGLRWDTAHLISFKRSKGSTGLLCEEAGSYGEPEWKSALSVAWKQSSWNGNLAFNYTGDYNDNGTGRAKDSCAYKEPESVSKVSSFTSVNVQVGYDFDFGTQLKAGIKNLADRAPSYTTEKQWPWFNQGLSNPVGRFYYLDLKHTF